MDQVAPEKEKFPRKWSWFLTLGFALLMWICAAIVSFKVDPEAAFWKRVVKLKQERVSMEREGRIEGPMIFVGGGSSCSFSIHPDVLTEVMGWRAVNMGGSAGMGYRYLIDLAASRAERGDIVILHLEPAIFRGKEKRMTPLAVKVDLARFPTGLSGGVFEDELYEEPVAERLAALRPGAKFLGTLAAKMVRSGPLYRYQLADIRGNGTLSCKTSAPNPDVGSFKAMRHWLDDRVVQEDLRKLAEYAEERGVMIFFTLPWESFRSEVLVAQRDEHSAYLDGIAEHLPVLRDEMMGAVGDNSLFLDTGYHMTEEGGRLRTRVLAEALKPFSFKEE